MLDVLTDSVQHPLGFVLPHHADHVDGHSGGDDAEADGALLRGLPDGDDDEEEAGEHETQRQQNVHLRGGGGGAGGDGKILTATPQDW